MHKNFPSGLCVYFVRRLDFYGSRQPLVLGDGANVQMIPHEDGTVLLLPIGRADSLVSRYSMPFYSAFVKNIEYYIYALSGQYSVRNGFTHAFHEPNRCKFIWQQDAGSLASPHHRLFKLYPVEQVIDKVNTGTGFKVMQFED